MHPTSSTFISLIKQCFLVIETRLIFYSENFTAVLISKYFKIFN